MEERRASVVVNFKTSVEYTKELSIVSGLVMVCVSLRKVLGLWKSIAAG